MDQIGDPKKIHKYEAPKHNNIRAIHPEVWLGRGKIVSKGFLSEK